MTHRDRVNMINEKLNRRSMLALVAFHTFYLCIIGLLASLVLHFIPSFLSFLIKSNQLQSLVSNRGEKIVFSNKLKDIWFADTKEVWKSFSRKAVDEIPVTELSVHAEIKFISRISTYNSPRHSNKIGSSWEACSSPWMASTSVVRS